MPAPLVTAVIIAALAYIVWAPLERALVTYVGVIVLLPAALTLPNTPGNLREWLRDPQHVKPGNRMPNLELSEPDWTALQRYVESLH